MKNLKQANGKNRKKVLGVSRIEVRHEMLLFLAASYGITSTSVSWFIYFMSKTLEVQKKIKKGLSEYNGQRLSIKHMDSFIYLECVLDEVLRLVARVLARDKLYWADLCDLNEFHPEIYLNDPENQNNLGALMPFGGEHRMCMNEDLARLELKLFCARLM
ncbi:unnamed protein product [Rotaria magnacalcarata]|uniref:Cytochrome P450 n=1 Tax=Rotaria magnacalcarata TaxID=392030 RepID=A0A815HL28_9BILA|nr:unnamed protein product [Rotaria magnacalcarata]